jgi:hypothetical protein
VSPFTAILNGRQMYRKPPVDGHCTPCLCHAIAAAAYSNRLALMHTLRSSLLQPPAHALRPALSAPALSAPSPSPPQGEGQRERPQHPPGVDIPKGGVRQLRRRRRLELPG